MSNSDTPIKQQSPEQTKPRARKTNTLQNVAALKILLNAIAIQPRTRDEIVEITGLVNSTVTRWVAYLHTRTKEQRNLIYIAEWKRKGERGNWAACFALGYNESDVPKPAPMTNAEYRQRWLQKKSGTQTKVTKKGIKHVLR